MLLKNNESLNVPKDFLLNPKMCFRTKGLICYLLSLPYQVFETEIVMFANIKDVWTQDAIDFLEEMGYITNTLQYR